MPGRPKSAVELAMEKVDADMKVRELNDEQREKIAEIRAKYRAKIAEAEISYNDRVRKAAQQGEASKASDLREELAREKRRLEAEAERKAEKVRTGE